MATTVPTSTSSSRDDFSDEAGQAGTSSNTSTTLAGEATTKRSSKRKQMPSKSQASSKLKRSTESASLSGSNSSDTSKSSKCARPRPKRRKKLKEPTENHLKIRRVVDAGRIWELELEQVHGLTDEEACVVVSIVAKYYNLKVDEFPPDNGDRFLTLAKKGWELANENARLHQLYPECHDQTSSGGVWKML
eukprot:scaffold55662_cov53-Attheya_sp.AAC.2